MSLYEQIDKYRKKRNIKSMLQLSKLADVSYTCLAELKSGRTKSLSANNSQKIANALDITLEQLYGDEVKPICETQVSVNSKAEKLLEIFDAVRILPDDVLDKVLEYINKLACNIDM